MRYYRLISILLASLVLPVTGFYGSDAHGQPLHADILLEQPAPFSTNRLDALSEQGEPRIGLFFSAEQIALRASDGDKVRKAVMAWEYFLQGLALPYVVIPDTTAFQTYQDSLQLLIVPAATSLTEPQFALMGAFVAGGGSMISSGYMNYVDSLGEAGMRSAVAGFMHWGKRDKNDVYGRGVVLDLQGNHAVLEGLSSGFPLSILCEDGCATVPPDGMKALGLFRGNQSEGVVANTRPQALLALGAYGTGRTLWMGFDPHQVSSEPDHQHVYQQFMIQAMAYLTKTPYAAVKPWPKDYVSASAIIQLPTNGYSAPIFRASADLVLRSLEAGGVRPTFFMTQELAQRHPDVVDRMAVQGELGLVADSEQPLLKQPAELQERRLAGAKAYLEVATNETIRGLHAPGLLYDANTLRAMLQLDMRYIIKGDGQGIVPELLDWRTAFDYRDSLLAEGAAGYTGRDAIGRSLLEFTPTTYSFELDAADPSGSNQSASDPLQERWMYRLRDAFNRRHEAGGLFLFAYEPDIVGMSQPRAEVLTALGQFLSAKPTWVATLDQLADWWQGRQDVSISYHVQEEGPMLIVTNEGEVALNNVSLYMYDPTLDTDHTDIDSATLDVHGQQQAEGLHVTIDRLTPGEHILFWNASQLMKAGEQE